jgi:hypothetical protein
LLAGQDVSVKRQGFERNCLLMISGYFNKLRLAEIELQWFSCVQFGYYLELNWFKNLFPKMKSLKLLCLDALKNNFF